MNDQRSLFSGVLDPEPVPSVSVKQAEGQDVPVSETMLAEVYVKLMDLSAEIRSQAGPPGTNQDRLSEKREEWCNLLKVYERLDDTLDAQADRKRGANRSADMPLVGPRTRDVSSGSGNAI